MKKHIDRIIPNANIYFITTCLRVKSLESKYRKSEIENTEKEDLVTVFRCSCGEGTYIGETGLTSYTTKINLREKKISRKYSNQ